MIFESDCSMIRKVNEYLILIRMSHTKALIFVMVCFSKKKWNLYAVFLACVGLNIFHLYTLYIEKHINTYNNIQFSNWIQKKVFRLM